MLYGGYNDGNHHGLDDMWEWDGSNWTQLSQTTSPGVRRGHAMSYDATRNVIVLFGGDLSDRDPWEWDGLIWTHYDSATKPGGRQDHAMAYDSARGVTVMFGGRFGASPYFSTWEWDGANWSLRNLLTYPSARFGHVMAYDSALGVSRLFGGTFGFDNLRDTWEWDGTNWTQSNLEISPLARLSGAMVYDSARNVNVLFGGLNNSIGTNIFFGDTWEFGACRPCELINDGSVNGADFTEFLLSFGLCNGHPSFNSSADLDGDSCVTLADYQLWLQCYRDSIGNAVAAPPSPSDMGDINADARLDGLDVQPFVGLVLNPATAGLRDRFVADMNGDGAINSADITGFVDLLLSPTAGGEQ